MSEAVKISDFWITKKRLFQKGNSFLSHFCIKFHKNFDYIFHTYRIESYLFFFKSFQILSNPWWYFDNRFWNVDPSQLVSHRVWTSNVINWLKFCPSFRKFSSSHCVSSWLLFTYFSSKRYRSHGCFANGIWGMEWKLFGKWSMKVEWMRAASLILKSLTRWYLLWIWRRKRKNRVR